MGTSERELLDILRRQIQKAGSLRQAAQRYGVSVQYLSDVLRQRRRLGPTLLKALGYKLDRVRIERSYVKV